MQFLLAFLLFLPTLPAHALPMWLRALDVNALANHSALLAATVETQQPHVAVQIRRRLHGRQQRRGLQPQGRVQPLTRRRELG